jgi:DNA replication protein DnaC
MKYRFARMTNAQYDEIEAKVKMMGGSLDRCPTCLSKPFKVQGDEERPGEAEGRIYGTYRYRGEQHECDCETQMALYRHYLAANLGEQYMRLDWNDFRNEAVREFVNEYLAKFDSFKRHGMGMEFGGETLGVGKTFSATYVGKELVKRGHRVRFIRFLDFIRLTSRMQTNEDAPHKEYDKLRSITVLILDEVRPPMAGGQAWYFADRFEELIRHRTDFNLPTIITTNLTESQLLEHYPRPYSLLAAKQIRVELTGQDARASWMGEHNLDLAINEEIAPIT